MDLENYFENSKVYIWKETFVIIKSKKLYPNAFANIIDKNETTVIVEQSKYNDEDVMEIEKGWKLLTFDMVLPFGLVGFLPLQVECHRDGSIDNVKAAHIPEIDSVIGSKLGYPVDDIESFLRKWVKLSKFYITFFPNGEL